MVWQADCSIIIGKCESRGRVTRMITFLITFLSFISRVVPWENMRRRNQKDTPRARAYLKVIKLPYNSNLLNLYYTSYLILNWFQSNLFIYLSIYSLKHTKYL